MDWESLVIAHSVVRRSNLAWIDEIEENLFKEKTYDQKNYEETLVEMDQVLLHASRGQRP